MLSLFTMPGATSTLTNVGTWSGALFDDLLQVVYIVAGLLIACMLVSLLIRSIIRGVKKVTGGGGRGRSRRR